MPRMSFTVSFSADVDRETAQEYIADAVQSWKGQFCPGTPEENFEDRNPLLDLHSVKVRDNLTKKVVLP